MATTAPTATTAPMAATSRSRSAPGRPGTLRAATLAATGFALLALAPATVRGASAVRGQASPPDSAELEEELRDAQRRFEWLRRRRFPLTSPGWGRCDERIGRYCLTHEDDEDREPRPPPPEVVERRDELIGRLSEAAARLPGSRWVAGQRVWYLVEADRPGEAVAAARACRAGEGWCRALEGFALHEAELYPEAEEAFRRALASLRPEERRALTSPEEVLEGDARDRWEEAGEERRAELEARLWWLADPLWLVDGSERWTEHLARAVTIRVQREAAGPFGSYWHDELEELTTRYGWPVDWERVRRRAYRIGEPEDPVVAHHAPDALRFVPPPEVWEDPTAATPEGWELDPDEPRSTYQPAYLDTLHRPAAHRVVTFPRPDSTLVVAVWRTGWEAKAPTGAGALSRPAEAMLRADEAPGRTLASVRGASDRDEGRLLLALPARHAVLSLEVLDRDGRRAVRLRRGLSRTGRPEGTPGMSDLLSVTAPHVPADSMRPPDDLRRAARRARLPGPAEPGERIGLYWELYGPARRLAGARLDLVLEREGGGFLRSLAEGLGLADADRRRVATGWRFAPERGRRVHPAGVVLTVPEELEEGEYRIAAEVRLPGYEPLRAELPLEVRER